MSSLSKSMTLNYRAYLMVCIGGMIGASLRYSLSLLFLSTGPFPYATLIANGIGCFLLSYLMFHKQIKNKLSPIIFTALSVGIIGSFTTFSTFAIETIILWQSHLFLALVYISFSILIGLVCCYGGYRLASGREV